MWLTGATVVKHFSRFYVFLGCPLYNKRWHLWGAVIRLAAQFVPEGEVIRVSFGPQTVESDVDAWLGEWRAMYGKRRAA